MSDVARFMRDPTCVKAAQEGLRRFHWGSFGAIINELGMSKQSFPRPFHTLCMKGVFERIALLLRRGTSS